MTAAIPLRLCGYQGDASVHTRSLRAFVAQLDRRRPGAFAVELTPDATAAGGTATALFADIEGGGTQVGYMASGYLSPRVPALRVLDLPFAFRDHDHAFGLLDGPAGQVLAEAVASGSGFHLLGAWDNGYRHVTSRRSHVLRPGDGAGQTIRAIENPIYFDAMRVLGFDPVAVDVRDLREAVATGRIDAQENPLTNCHLFDVARHQPFVSLTRHILGIVLFVANRDWFRDLPPIERHALQAAAVRATALQRDAARREEARVADLLKAQGADLAGAGAIDHAAMAAACAGIRAATLSDLDPAIARALSGC